MDNLKKFIDSISVLSRAVWGNDGATYRVVTHENINRQESLNELFQQLHTLTSVEFKPKSVSAETVIEEFGDFVRISLGCDTRLLGGEFLELLFPVNENPNYYTWKYMDDDIYWLFVAASDDVRSQVLLICLPYK